MDKKPKKSSKSSDIDYDGVIYTPSYNSENGGSSKNQRNLDDNSKPLSSPKKKPPKSQFKLLLIITIISGILIFIIVFSIVYGSLKGKTPSINTTTETEFSANTEITSIETPPVVTSEKIGVIRSIESGKDAAVSIYSISENKTYNLTAAPITQLNDKYGGNMLISEFERGDVVNFTFDEETNKLVTLIENSDTWEYDNISNVKINQELKLLTKDNKDFKYSDLTVVKYNNNDYDITKIDPVDVITIKGYRDNVYYVNIEKSHGYIQVTNFDKLKEGVIEVDTDIYKALEISEKIKVSDGEHKVVIQSTNSEPFTKEITVNAGETYVLDLSSVKSKTGVLLIKTNVTDYTLYINSIMEFSREPLTLDYGAYTVRIEKEGYLPYETQLSVDRSQIVLNAELTKEETKNDVKMIKLELSTNPPGANVYIDNMYVGISPVTKEIVEGSHSITIKLNGYSDTVLNSLSINDDNRVYNITLFPLPNAQQQTTTQTQTQTTTQAPEQQNQQESQNQPNTQ